MAPAGTAAPSVAVPAEHLFDSHTEASAALATRVAADLAAAVAERGTASLAVPGGTTPGEFLASLGEQAVDWQRVTVLLTDERWVPATHARSNTGLVRRTLGRGGERYRWFPLWRQGVGTHEAIAMLEADAGEVNWPLDVLVLGMGDDGHVASLFPGDEAGFASPTSRFVAVRGPGDEPRVSLSAAVFAQARNTYLLLRGAARLEVMRGALGGELPVARVVAARRGRVHVFAGIS
jgi:6-phosphogluconolactonase